MKSSPRKRGTRSFLYHSQVLYVESLFVIPPTPRLASADAETGYGGRVEGQALLRPK
jgi:hypothetical protein